MGNLIFARCKKCGNFVAFIGKKSGCTPQCCGEEMTVLKANSTDGANEKHVPDVTIDGDKVSVQVGSVLHPATEEHHIAFICLETETGCQLKNITPGDEPKAEFLLNGDKAVAVYEFCNLHGLWVKEL